MLTYLSLIGLGGSLGGIALTLSNAYVESQKDKAYQLEKQYVVNQVKTDYESQLEKKDLEIDKLSKNQIEIERI